MNIIYCSDSCDFWSAYLKQFQSKACFLVCKIFSLFFWSVKYSASNITSFIMQINDQTIHIHNVYFKFFSNYTHIDQKKKEKILCIRKHILLWNCLKYAGQKSQLLEQCMTFMWVFCQNSCKAIISHFFFIIFVTNTIWICFLLLCMLYWVRCNLIIIQCFE